MFPVSWIVSSRQADVATIVEENVTGTRVVKSFAAEPSQIRLLANAATRLRWAASLQVDIRAKYSPYMQNLPRLGLAMVLLYGGWLYLQGDVSIGTIVEFNFYVVMLQMPFMMLGFLMMMGQRAAASAGRIFEIIDEPPEIIGPRRRHRPHRSRGRRGVRGRRVLLHARRAARARGLRPPHGAGRDRRTGRPHRNRQVDGGPPAPPLLRGERGRHPHRRPRRARPHRRVVCARTSAWCSTSRSSSRRRSATTSPTASPTPRRRRSTRWPRPPASPSSSTSCPRASTRWSASAATRCAAASASASPSPARCS